MRLHNSNLHFSGGYRIFEITNHTKDFEWVELSQSHDTFEPFFLIPGSESKPLIKKIAEKVDFLARLNKDLDEVKFRGRDLILHTHFSFVADGKLVTICSGSGGAHCTSCTKSRADHLMFFIFQHQENLPMDRTNEFLRQTYDKLKKKKSGEIATKTGKINIT